MAWTDVFSKVGELAKLINNLEFQFKEQGSEIERLRNTNAELLKANSNLAERVARLEEARNTMGVQMAAFLEKQETNAKMNKILERLEAVESENEALKHRHVSPSDTNPPAA